MSLRMDQRFTPAVSIALVNGDRVLLVRRGRPPSMGLYAFPGGRVEQDEALEDAVRRELREETTLEAGPVRLVTVLDLAGEPPSPAFRLHVFTASYVGGEAIAGDDAAEARWFTVADMDQLPVIASVRAVAEELIGAA